MTEQEQSVLRDLIQSSASPRLDRLTQTGSLMSDETLCNGEKEAFCIDADGRAPRWAQHIEVDREQNNILFRYVATDIENARSTLPPPESAPIGPSPLQGALVTASRWDEIRGLFAPGGNLCVTDAEQGRKPIPPPLRGQALEEALEHQAVKPPPFGNVPPPLAPFVFEMPLRDDNEPAPGEREHLPGTFACARCGVAFDGTDTENAYTNDRGYRQHRQCPAGAGIQSASIRSASAAAAAEPFGMVDDGFTDNRAAIQAMIDAQCPAATANTPAAESSDEAIEVEGWNFELEHTNAERVEIQQYLMHRWGIPTPSVPADAPFDGTPFNYSVSTRSGISATAAASGIENGRKEVWCCESHTPGEPCEHRAEVVAIYGNGPLDVTLMCHEHIKREWQPTWETRDLTADERQQWACSWEDWQISYHPAIKVATIAAAAIEAEPFEQAARPYALSCEKCRLTPLRGYVNAAATRFFCGTCYRGGAR